MSYASEVLADSPTIYLKLDDTSGTTAIDSSGNSYNGTYAGQYVLSQTSLVDSDASGKAVLFSDSGGTSGKVSIPVVTLSMTWAIEMFIKPVSGTGVGGEQCLFLARSDSDLYNAIWLVYDIGAQSITLYGSISSGAYCFTGVTITDIFPDVSYHVVATMDGSAARLYVNGIEVANDTSLNGTINITTSATDGAYSVGAPFSDSYPAIYGGCIDEVAIYSGSYLSAARVLAHYVARLIPTAQNFLPPPARGTRRAAHFPFSQLRL